MTQQRAARRSAAFSLVELLVVIGIIVVLIGLLIPVVSRVRTSARNANTSALISQLSNAINQYFNDFKAYPGPLTNVQVWNSNNPANMIDVANATSEGFANTPNGANFTQKITMSENLVLGLLGGLKRDAGTGNIQYDPRLVGNGPNSLTSNPAAAKSYKAYVEATNLSWLVDGNNRKTGKFKDDAGEADDTIIPEFVDAYSNPMPILYLRAKRGAPAVRDDDGTASSDNNGIITYDSADPDRRLGQYDLHQIAAYTFADTSDGNKTIGVGKKQITYYEGSASPVTLDRPPYHGLSISGNSAGVLPNAIMGPPGNNYYYPYNAYPYFRSKAMSSGRVPVPHNKDGFILISAGPDRIYGTDDDITNFGPVGN